MFDSHRSLLARHIGPLFVFGVKRELSVLEYFLVFCFCFCKTAPRCSDLGIDYFFRSVFEVCGLSEVFKLSLFHFP